jgi:hypothetical protein
MASTNQRQEARARILSAGTTGNRTWEAALHLGSFLASETGEALVRGLHAGAVYLTNDSCCACCRAEGFGWETSVLQLSMSFYPT